MLSDIENGIKKIAEILLKRKMDELLEIIVVKSNHSDFLQYIY